MGIDSRVLNQNEQIVNCVRSIASFDGIEDTAVNGDDMGNGVLSGSRK